MVSYSANGVIKLKNGLPLSAGSSQNPPDPNTALLQQLVTRLCPATNRQITSFSGTNGVSGAQQQVPGSPNITINGFINSLVTGTVYVYLQGAVISDPTNPPPPDLYFVAGGNGSDQIHLDPYNPTAITFLVVGATPAFGSIIAICY